MKEHNFGLIKKIVSAGKETSYEKIQDVFSGSFLGQAEGGFLGKIKENMMEPKKIKLILDILGGRLEEPRPISEVIKIPQELEFNNLAQIELNEKDVKFINFAIRYLEKWFFDGKWARLSEKQIQQPKAYAYFGVPAVILNSFTKLKENPENKDKMVGFDLKNFKDLDSKLLDFVQKFISEENLRTLSKKAKGDNSKIENLLGNRDSILKSFYRSRESLFRELEHRGGSRAEAPDLYAVKTCLIAGEMARKKQLENQKNYNFIPEIPTENRYVTFDFSKGHDRYSTMHYHADRILYFQFLFEYLRTRK